MKGGYSASSIFASKLICADCGSFYGKKVWHSNSPHRKEIYQCNSKFKDKNAKCKTPHLSEEEIKDKFIIAFNKLFEAKDEIIENCHQIKNLLTDVSEEEKQIEEANIEIDIVSELVKKLINDNSNKAQDQEKYQERYNELLSRYEKAKKLLKECEERKQSKTTKGIVIEDFIKTLKEANSSLTSWSDSIWLTSIDKCLINEDKTIEFHFKNGSKIKV